MKTKSGEWKWILDTGKVTSRDEKGLPLRAVGTQVDITERKNIEEIDKIEVELSVKLSKTDSLDETLRICLESALLNSGIDAGGIYIENNSDGSYSLLKHSGLSDDFVKSASYYSYDSDKASVIREGKPVYTIHSEVIGTVENMSEEMLKALAIIPIIYMNKPIGCFNIASRTMEDFPVFYEDNT
ncbi:MAG: hypothetical protein IPN68_19935 [Bacteroidetes bacterium]|nr:hypothetical protein [Bacteroidota bacterium]